MVAGHPVLRVLYWQAGTPTAAAVFGSAAGLAVPALYYGKRGVSAAHEQFPVYG